jgi:hypothetical protein
MDESYANELLKKAVISGDIEIDKDSLDIANTNAFLDDNVMSSSIANIRNVVERKTVISINSSNREIYTYIIYPRNSFGFYVRNNSGNPEEITPTLLNNEALALGNPILLPFSYLANGDIAERRYKYEYPSNYVLQLPKTYINVKSIRLLSMEIPNNIYNITLANNTIMLDLMKNGVRVDFGPGIYFLEFAINVGRYDNIADLLGIICAGLSTVSTHVFISNYVGYNGLISISMADPEYSFHIKFKPDDTLLDRYSLWKMLGFRSAYEIDTNGEDKFTTLLRNADQTGIRPYTFPNLFPDSYIYLCINDYSNIEEADDKNMNLKYFTKIFTIASAQDKFISSPIIFISTIDKLSHLHIKFITLSGDYVDFNNQDHSFTLEIIEYLDELDNIRMNTRRGISDKKWYPDIIKTN